MGCTSKPCKPPLCCLSHYYEGTRTAKASIAGCVAIPYVHPFVVRSNQEGQLKYVLDR